MLIIADSSALVALALCIMAYNGLIGSLMRWSSEKNRQPKCSGSI